MDLEQRIIELETRLAYQEQTLAELNQVLTAQQRRQAELERQLGLLREHLLSLAAAPAAAEDAPPPHY